MRFAQLAPTSSSPFYEQEHEMTFEVTERLYLTEDDRVVADGDPDARWLYAVPGKRITLEEAEKYGLADGGPADSESDSDSVDSAEETAGEPVETSGGSVAESSPEAPSEPSKKRRGRKK